MIDNLKRRFVIIGTISVFVFLLIIVSIINVMNYNSMVQSVDKVIDVISKPDVPFFIDIAGNRDPREDFGDFLPKNMSPEVPYETRFFTVTVSPFGQIIKHDRSRIISIFEDEEIEEYVNKAIKKNKEYGFIDEFRFKRINETFATRYIFVDCGRRLDTFYSELKISIIIALLSCLISSVVFIAVSGKVVSPIVENYNKQKSFITNAGHEIKTPLTIISANIDLFESEYESIEYIEDIKKQTNKLKDLTNNLIYLSKTEENEFDLNKVEVPFSDLVQESIDNFNSSLLKNKIKIINNIESLTTIVADQGAIERVLNILIENAIKYSIKEGMISINLYTKGKRVIFSIENETQEEINEQETKDIFERFYRMDKARNSEVGGHGLGLSIAKALVEANDGKIVAKKTSTNKLLIEITFKKQFTKSLDI